MTRKRLELSNLSLFWDTSPPPTGTPFSLVPKLPTPQGLDVPSSTATATPTSQSQLLGPVSGRGKLLSYKRYDPAHPLHSLALEFQELALAMDDQQFRSFNTFFHDLSRTMEHRQHLAFRPPRNITPHMDPRGWLKYALNSVLQDVRERRRRWTWDYLRERRDTRRAYITAYKLAHATSSRQGTPTTTPITTSSQSLHGSHLQQLEALERALSFEDVCFYRKLARLQLKRERALSAATSPAATASATTTTVGWLSSMVFGTSPASSPSQASAPGQGEVLSEAQLQTLYDAIDYDPNQATSSPEYPPSAVLFQLHLELASGSLSLQKLEAECAGAGEGAGRPRPLAAPLFRSFLTCAFKRMDVQLSAYQGRYQGVYTLHDVSVRDSSAAFHGSLFPDLLRRKLLDQAR